MKTNFLSNAFQYEGGFTPEQKSDLQESLKKVQDAIESKNRDEIKAAIKENGDTLNEAIKKFNDKLTERDEADKENQKALDDIIAKVKTMNGTKEPGERKSFQQAFSEELVKPENVEGLKSVGKNRPWRIVLPESVSLKNFYESVETKTVGDMSTGNITGDSVATYRSQPAIVPAQKINFRDLLPTVHSDTGLYVSYAETGTEGSIGIQTEGSAKSQIDYDMTEIKTVNKYVAGFARFTKQLAKSLPFMQNTLPRQLLRDFYKKENRYFYDKIVTGATGSATSANTVHIKKLVDWIGNQHQADYNASYVLVSHVQMAELLNELISNGAYLGAGSVVGLPNGSITVGGVPVIPASWVPSNDVALVFDTDFVERVEVEGIAVEFFLQDANNVTENKITARIECYEEINRMLASSVILGDFGDTATS